MKRIKIKSLFYLSLLMSLTACLDQIDLEVPADLQDSIVIMGSVTIGNPSVVNINVNRVFDFDISSLQPFNTREVVLLDDKGNSVSIPDFAGGNYYLEIPQGDPTMPITLDGQYKVRVSTFDGRVFESSLEAFQPVPKPDSLSYRLVPVEILQDSGNPRTLTFLSLAISTPLIEAGEPRQIQWAFDQVFRVTDSPGIAFSNAEPKTCYIDQTIGVNTIELFNSKELGLDRLDEFDILLTSITSNFAEGSYITVYQQSLSDGAFEYWNQINAVLQREGNMFEAPVGRFITNITSTGTSDEEDEVFGYFYAIQQDTIRVFVDPTTLGNVRTTCPPDPGPPGSDPCLAQICCDCLSVPNSTTEQPSFW